MSHTCAVKFDMTRNLEKFLFFLGELNKASVLLVVTYSNLYGEIGSIKEFVLSRRLFIVKSIKFW